MRDKTLEEKIEYHKKHIHMYRAIPHIDHKIRFKPVVKGGNVYLIPIDDEEE